MQCKENGKSNRGACAAVVPAAGSSSRMNGSDKLFYELDGVPVLARTLCALQSCRDIDAIVIAARGERAEDIAKLCREYGIDKLDKIVVGGESRLHSVLAGVRAVDKSVQLVAIHDAARPLVSHEVISSAIDAARRMGAAAPAVPLKDTVKRARGNVVVDTPEREELFAVQTPQVFDRELVLGALSHAEQSGIAVTDDCSAVEAVGMSVYLTPGDYCNIKITTPEDYMFAEAILAKAEKGLKEQCE